MRLANIKVVFCIAEEYNKEINLGQGVAESCHSLNEIRH